MKLDTPCVLWPKPAPNGYGYKKIKGRTYLAHRLTYLALHGRIPDGLELDHLCCTPACYNPDHLEAVTHLENVRRAAAVRYGPACPSGHVYDETNTLYYQGRRRCRECANVRRRNGRGRPRIKDCCPLGHPRTPDNMTAHGRCLACKRERSRLKRREQRNTA